MPDREKVVKGLEVCVNRVPGKYSCYECPYENDGNSCEINLTKDALALLKEQCELRKTYVEACDDLYAIAKNRVDVVRCKDCKYRPTQTEPPKTYGFSIEFPKGSRCPCECDDGFYSWYPNDNWFCADGERRTDDG